MAEPPVSERSQLLRRALEANAARQRRPSVAAALAAILSEPVPESSFRSVEDTCDLQDWIEAKVSEVGTSKRWWTMDLMGHAIQVITSYSATPGTVLLVPRLVQPAEAVELPDWSVLAATDRLIQAVPYFSLVSPDRALGIAFDWGWRDHEEWVELASWGAVGAGWGA